MGRLQSIAAGGLEILSTVRVVRRFSICRAAPCHLDRGSRAYRSGWYSGGVWWRGGEQEKIEDNYGVLVDRRTMTITK